MNAVRVDRERDVDAAIHDDSNTAVGCARAAPCRCGDFASVREQSGTAESAISYLNQVDACRHGRLDSPSQRGPGGFAIDHECEKGLPGDGQ